MCIFNLHTNMSRIIIVSLCFLLWPLLSAVSQESYRLLNVRPLNSDTITFKCQKMPSGELINIERNQSITFWLNRTRGIRNGEANLRERNDLPGKVVRGETFTFQITPELEGLYSCGRIGDAGNTVESEVNYFICKCTLHDIERFRL